MSGLSGISGDSGLSGLVGAASGGLPGLVTSSDLLHLWAAEPLVAGYSGPILRGVRQDNFSSFDAINLDAFDAAISGTTGEIDRFYDQKGSNALSCIAPSARPVYVRTTINGKDALDQSADALCGHGLKSSIIAGFPLTMYCVAKDIRDDTFPTRGQCFSFRTSVFDYVGFACKQTTDLSSRFYYDPGAGTVALSLVGTNPALFTMTVLGSTNASLSVNGGTAVSAPILSVGSPVFFQFNALQRGGKPTGWCKFACIAISAGRSTEIESQLKAHYGL